MITEEILEKIENSLINSIRDRTKTGFDTSQTRVPVVTGNLKKSGSYTDIDKGGQIKYAADYANVVERGCAEHLVVIPSSYNKRGVFVKGYLRKQPARVPKKYIESSLKESYEKFADEMTSELNSKFDKVIRE